VATIGELAAISCGIDCVNCQHAIHIPWLHHDQPDTPCLLLTIMSSTLVPAATQRKRSTALVEDDVEAAEAVTHEKITHTTRSGKTRVKTVFVPLVPVVEQEKPFRAPVHQEDPIDFQANYKIPDQEQNPLPKTGKVDIVITANLTYTNVMLH